MTSPRVLISGAGIAGLALAHRFEQLGIEYELLEKRNPDNHGGSGIALPMNAMRALRILGLADPVLEVAYQVHQITYAQKTGAPLGRASLLETPFHKDKFVALQRSKLYGILLDSLRSRVHFNTVIQSLNVHSDGVDIVCSDPTLSGRFDVIISAEGIHSGLRQYCFPTEATVVDHKVSNWRFLVEYPKHCLEPIYMFDRTEMFMVYPVSPDSLYCYAHVHDDLGRYKSGNPVEHLQKLFGGFGGDVKSILEIVDEQHVLYGRLESLARPYYAKDRIVFVGDAGHGCSPLLQQGAALAFEDAICIADQLCISPVDQAIIKYQRLRAPEVEWAMEASDKPLKLMKFTNSHLGAFIRNLIIRRRGPLNVDGWRQLALRRI